MCSWKFREYYVEMQKSAASIFFSYKKPLILCDNILETFSFFHFLAAEDLFAKFFK